MASTPLSLARRYRAGRRSPEAPGESNTQHSALPWSHGALAQLGERRLCKPEVTGSIPVRSIRESAATKAFPLTYLLTLKPRCKRFCKRRPVPGFLSRRPTSYSARATSSDFHAPTTCGVRPGCGPWSAGRRGERMVHIETSCDIRARTSTLKSDPWRNRAEVRGLKSGRNGCGVWRVVETGCNAHRSAVQEAAAECM